MTADWDGKIRMDCSSPYAMARLVGMRDKFDVAFANDTDADRHGIVTRIARPDEPEPLPRRRISYLFEQSSGLGSNCAIGKTVVSSAMIDRVVTKLGRKLVEVPVGFKWFVDGLERAAARLRRRGKRRRNVPARATARSGPPTRTGSSSGLLAAEMTARHQTGSGPEFDGHTDEELGVPFYERIDAPATSRTEGHAEESCRPIKLGSRRSAAKPCVRR